MSSVSPDASNPISSAADTIGEGNAAGIDCAATSSGSGAALARSLPLSRGAAASGTRTTPRTARGSRAGTGSGKGASRGCVAPSPPALAGAVRAGALTGAALGPALSASISGKVSAAITATVPGSAQLHSTRDRVSELALLSEAA